MLKGIGTEYKVEKVGTVSGQLRDYLSHRLLHLDLGGVLPVKCL